MIKKILILVLILVLLIIPLKLVRVFFSTKMDVNIPSVYMQTVPKNYLKGHIYSIVSESKTPVSFFRSNDADLVTTQINYNKTNNFIIHYTKPTSVENEISEVFNFTNAQVLNTYNDIKKDDKIEQISFESLGGDVVLKNQNGSILKFSSDFKILLNEKSIFNVETNKNMFVIIKNMGNTSQLYIVGINNKANVENVLAAFK